MKITIDIPDGKLCELIKKDKTVFECPCLRYIGDFDYPECGLYHVSLDGTYNSTRKCEQCKNENK